ncbi:MAG: hypothetical protein V4449_02475 [Patescibacteria group bacterium]
MGVEVRMDLGSSDGFDFEDITTVMKRAFKRRNKLARRLFGAPYKNLSSAEQRQVGFALSIENQGLH